MESGQGEVHKRDAATIELHRFPSQTDSRVTSSKRGIASSNENGSTPVEELDIDADDETFQHTRLISGPEPGSRTQSPDENHRSEPIENTRFRFSPSSYARLLLLFTLYVCETLPTGIAAGTLPVLLKPSLDYGSVGLLSIILYPFSMKILWSPLIDSLWFPTLGRRKSWILPTLLLSGIVMLVLGANTKRLMESVGSGNSTSLAILIGIWFILLFLAATQGCAIDGWALTLLPREAAHATSTAHGLGIVVAWFVSYSLFLALHDSGLVSLSGFTVTIGIFNLIVAAAVYFTSEGEPEVRRKPQSVLEAYASILQLFRLVPVRTLVVVHLLSEIGFQVNDGATGLKLLDKGFGENNIALLTAIMAPFDLLTSFAAGKLCERYAPLYVWTRAFMARLTAALIAQFLLMIYPKQDHVSRTTILEQFLGYFITTATSTVMSISAITFHLQVSDPAIGSIYMTLLATAFNIGITLPKLIVLRLIDWTTISSCEFSGPAGNGRECNTAASKLLCQQENGLCNIKVDGYYVTNIACVFIGGLLFFSFLKAAVLKLQALPRSSWVPRVR